jgi:hypothetical protein
MGGRFDPSALMSLSSSLGDDGEVISVGEDELRRIAGADVRRKCAGIKLASRIVGMATIGREDMNDADVLRSMQALMSRIGVLRKAALEAVGAERGSPDYKAAFNAVTNVVMDLLTEEWKWSRIGETGRMLAVDGLGKLLEMAAGSGPVYLDMDDAGDVATLRRLCILEAMPKLWAAVNMFDYYQPEREKMVARLARAVSEQAEAHANTLYSDTSPTFAIRALVQRMYGVSTGLMCEVYKDIAARDVARLRAMPELDRSVLLTQYERTGMTYDHIIERHRTVMDRTLDMTNLILEAQKVPQRRMESSYGA